jgi:RNA recognition motif-containing protein
MSQPTLLFFDGLTQNVFSELLLDLCARYGTVLSANAFVDGAGCCLGAGYVEMATSDSAEQAAKELDGSLVLGQVIRVYLVHGP